MRKRIVQCLILIIAAGGIFTNSYLESSKPIQVIDDNTKIENPQTLLNMINSVKVTIEPSDVFAVGESEETENVEVESEPLVFPDSYFNPETEGYREEEFWDDMELLALVCVAEAEGESELGKRLVIDSVLNRVDSPNFPNTIWDVVYQANPPQYSCVWDGRLEKVEYDEYIASLVMDEFNNRTNSDVIYFKTEGYFNHGTPIIHEGHHYFSGR